jgi:hypothetical protein
LVIQVVHADAKPPRHKASRVTEKIMRNHYAKQMKRKCSKGSPCATYVNSYGVRIIYRRVHG